MHTIKQYKKMKHYLYLFLLPLAVMACSHKQTMDRLARVDLMLDSLQTDSAKSVLSTIDISKTSKEATAYYTLLSTQYQYIIDNDFRDTTRLNGCIKFYAHSKDKEKLARSYYYKGELCFRSNDIANAINNEKHAEYILSKCNLQQKRNLILYQKICEGLAFINIQYGEYRLALHYAKLALHSLKQLNDKRYQTYELGMMSACYQRLGYADSTTMCIEEIVPLAQHADASCRGYTYNLLARHYIYLGELDKGKQFLDSSLCYAKDAFTYLAAGNYYYAVNEKERAEKEWKHGLNEPGTHLIAAEIHKCLAQLYKERGDMDNYSAHMEMEAGENNQTYTANNNTKVSEMQVCASNSLFIKNLFDKITLASLIFLALLTVTAIVVYNKIRRLMRLKKRMKHSHDVSLTAKTKELEATNAKLELAQNKINTLKKENTRKSDKLAKMSGDIVSATQNSETNAQQGRLLFRSITEGDGSTVAWSADDYRMCLSYCKIEYAHIVADIESSYEGLSNRKMLTILLKRLGYDYTAIGRMLGINSTSVRKSIARINSTNT